MASSRVRPRLVWGGLTVAVAGMITLAAGMIASAAVADDVGAVAVAVGAVIAVRGGIHHDFVTAHGVQHELHGLATGGTHAGVVPGRMYDDPVLRRSALETSAQLEDVARATQTARVPDAAGPAGAVLLLIATALVVAQWSLLTQDPHGRRVGYVVTGAAIILALAGLRLVTSGRRRVVPCLLTLAAAIGLIAEGILAPDTTGLAVVEVAGGAVALVATAPALLTSRAARRAGRR